jgi:hypothetical protein
LRSKKNRFILLVEFRYRGREISREDILYIRALIERHPQESRRTLSTKLCEAWQWRQANGALRDMVCRGLLLMLDRAGQIELPPVSCVRHNPLAKRARPEPVRINTTPLQDRLRNLQRWSSSRCGAPGKSRCGTVCWRNIIISVTSSRWENT